MKVLFCASSLALACLWTAEAFVACRRSSSSSGGKSSYSPFAIGASQQQHSSPPLGILNLYQPQEQEQQSTQTCIESKHVSFKQWSAAALTTATTTANTLSLGMMILFLAVSSWSLSPLSASASNYGSLTDEQKLVAEAWRLVDNSYLDRTFNNQDWFQLRQDNVHRKYKSMEEAENAIDKMIASLGDKYTRYLSPGKYQSIVDSATGTLAGVGIEISVNSQGRVIAADVEEKSPAKTSGIQAGDVFVQVDGTDFAVGATPDDVALKLRGPKGSRVGVVMERNGKQLDYILTREPITITAVRSYLSNMSGVGKVGVVRIKSFSGTTAKIVSEKLADLKNKGAQAFVIDVRGNPGGLLPGGVDTAALFLEESQPIVFVVDKKGTIDSQSSLSTGPEVDDRPLIVLVDSNTASAAEVFTAALKENQRALIVGEQTFGKGIVQTIRPLTDNHGGVAITVARYETPQHHDINKQGIPVDVSAPVDCSKEDATACLKASMFAIPTK
jgi:carboxyl-terminal processing protease